MDKKSSIGNLLADSLDKLLEGIEKERVDPKRVVDQLNACFAPSNPEPEFEGHVRDSKAFRELKQLSEKLRKDPTTRSIVLDNEDSLFTEDGIWLSLPKWEALLGVPSIYWHVVTVRSIENKVFREAFPAEDEWKTAHQSGPFGTTFISKEEPGGRIHTRRRSGSDTSPKNKLSRKHHCGALFSDQPRMVALYGKTVGRQLWEVARKRDVPPKFVIRLFRCAPRASLTEHISRVVHEGRTDNVFDIWIRHHEMPVKVLGGFGKYVHTAGSDQVGILEKLTSIILPEDSTVHGSVCSSVQSFTTARYEDTSESGGSWASLVARPKEASDSESDWEDLPTQLEISEISESDTNWDPLLIRMENQYPPVNTMITEEGSSTTEVVSQDDSTLPWRNVLRRVC